MDWDPNTTMSVSPAMREAARRMWASSERFNGRLG
jgi:hypothetical protein